MKTPSLIRRFTLYSLIAFLVTGFILALFLSKHVQNDQLNNVKNLVLLALNTTIKTELTQNDFRTLLSHTKTERVDYGLKKAMEKTHIVGMNILNKDGFIIYSNNKTLLGARTEFDGIEGVFWNKVVHKISKPSYYEDFDGLDIQKPVIKIYAPIMIENQMTGVFEVYVPFSVVHDHIIHLNTIILITVFLGLATLYVLFTKTLFSTSRTLMEQNQSLLLKTQELEQSYTKLNGAYRNTVIALSEAVDARDAYTSGHSERVTAISLRIGQAMGLSHERLEILENAALFHDIGKLGIPDMILHKPNRLSDEEFNKIKEHPNIGINILRTIDFLDEALPIIRHHHEKYAGGGYPEGISGENIPLEARIIAVADTYDAITSDRPYRKGLPHDVAISELVKYQGIQFDPQVVEVFLEVVEPSKVIDFCQINAV